MEIIKVVLELGLPTTLVLFFVIHGKEREKKRDERITSLEEFQKNVLLGMVKDQSLLIASSTHIIKEATKVMERMDIENPTRRRL